MPDPFSEGAKEPLPGRTKCGNDVAVVSRKPGSGEPNSRGDVGIPASVLVGFRRSAVVIRNNADRGKGSRYGFCNGWGAPETMIEMAAA